LGARRVDRWLNEESSLGGSLHDSSVLFERRSGAPLHELHGTGGGRSGPPEDVGGSDGYARFLEAIADRRHPDHRMFREWIGKPGDPELFRPEEVVFSKPSTRLRRVLQGV
jgi:hypothetical protein